MDRRVVDDLPAVAADLDRLPVGVGQVQIVRRVVGVVGVGDLGPPDVDLLGVPPEGEVLQDREGPLLGLGVGGAVGQVEVLSGRPRLERLAPEGVGLAVPGHRNRDVRLLVGGVEQQHPLGGEPDQELRVGLPRAPLPFLVFRR